MGFSYGGSISPIGQPPRSPCSPSSSNASSPPPPPPTFSAAGPLSPPPITSAFSYASPPPPPPLVPEAAGLSPPPPMPSPPLPTSTESASPPPPLPTPALAPTLPMATAPATPPSPISESPPPATPPPPPLWPTQAIPPPPFEVSIVPHLYFSPPPPPHNPPPPLSPPPPYVSSPVPAEAPPSADTAASTSVPNPPPAHQHRAPRPYIKPRAVNSSFSSSFGRGSSVGPSKNIEISREAAATIVVLAGVVMIGFIGAAVWFVKKQRRQPEAPAAVYGGGQFVPSPAAAASSLTSDAFYMRSAGYLPNRHSSGSRGGFPPPPYSPASSVLSFAKMPFTPQDLSFITGGFSRANLLGEGGFGCVYKGCLPDGRQVAIKVLKAENGQGEREFKAEVDTISRVHHRHLVSLIGYCISDSQRMLVYDYVPNGTLYHHLHGSGMSVLEWSRRVKIAAGAARGIAYLHEDCHPRIIHRDIKSSNILLDGTFEAQVSDFGLAKIAADPNTHVTTRVMGTFGYMAPEYALSGKLTAKSDVYSFGVVLLELITGKKPVDSSRPLGDESLAEWAWPRLLHALETRDFQDLPDPRLENNFDEKEMYHMIEAAAACVRHSAVMRPRMGQVVRILDCLAEGSVGGGLPPGQSEVFPEPQSEEIRRFQLREFGTEGSRYGSDDLSQSSWRTQRDF